MCYCVQLSWRCYESTRGAAKLQHIVVRLLERRGRETIMYELLDCASHILVSRHQTSRSIITIRLKSYYRRSVISIGLTITSRLQHHPYHETAGSKWSMTARGSLVRKAGVSWLQVLFTVTVNIQMSERYGQRRTLLSGPEAMLSSSLPIHCSTCYLQYVSVPLHVWLYEYKVHGWPWSWSSGECHSVSWLWYRTILGHLRHWWVTAVCMTFVFM